VVLDEADRMLDLGFREDLEAILSKPPKGAHTHLVSATFAREVATLADRVQTNPARVEGTRLGVANVDIDHVIHLIAPNQRLDALINLLLADPNAQTLVFVRMRVDVAQVSRELKNAGFQAAGLSGEMEQRERNQTLAEFKRGLLRVLVATDVAARGIDVPEVTRVIHAEPPTNADGYTHRSGRTGRAGRKGVSALLVTTGQMVPVTRILRQAGIKHRFEAVPTAADVQKQIDLRIVAELTAPTEDELDPRLHVLAEEILASTTPQESVARLLSRLPDVQRVAPRDITPIVPPSAQAPVRRDRNVRDDRNARPSRFDRNERFDRNDRNAPRDERPAPREERPMREAPPSRGAAERPAQFKPAAAKSAVKPPRGSVTNATRPVAAEGGRKPPPRAAAPQQDEWVPFRVTWGQEHGADARRLLAMVCRRGDVRSADVGAIRIQRSFSVVNVNANVAQGFARATEKPDPRDPKVRIRLDARAD
jgi:ATP-dependent RNA helicase DeaD